MFINLCIPTIQKFDYEISSDKIVRPIELCNEVDLDQLIDFTT
jgi:hypothetical protein